MPKATAKAAAINRRMEVLMNWSAMRRSMPSVKLFPLVISGCVEPDTNVRTKTISVPPATQRLISDVGMPLLTFDSLRRRFVSRKIDQTPMPTVVANNVYMKKSRVVVSKGSLKSGFSTYGWSYPIR